MNFAPVDIKMVKQSSGIRVMAGPVKLHFSDDDPRAEYSVDPESSGDRELHAGQLKLFLSELRFLTEFAGDVSKQATLHYTGAAPGVHIPYLAALFPHVMFCLWDPRSFCCGLNGLTNVMLFNRKFKHSDAANIGTGTWHRPRTGILLFISDIRTGEVNNKFCDFERCCQNDMNDQFHWTQAIRPTAAMLKFRLPYSPGKTEYFAPMDETHLWAGIFAPGRSTEARLVVGPGRELKTYDNTEFEQRAYYFNKYVRPANHGSPLEIKENKIKVALEIDDCWDCCAMREVCLEFLNKKNEADDSPLREFIATQLGEFVISEIAEIIIGYLPCVTENELYEFIAAVIRNCKSAEKFIGHRK